MFQPRVRASSSEERSTEAAPSVSGELFPAVNVPAAERSNAVLSDASFSSEVSGRTLLSWRRSLNGTTRSSKKPAFHAAAALKAGFFEDLRSEEHTSELQ